MAASPRPSVFSLCLLACFVSLCLSRNPFDLEFKKGAAIGDSYAAGIGAGKQVDFSCSRYDGSYAQLVADDLELDSKAFTYTACSGAVISGIKEQASKLEAGQDFVIVSAGGNDADLSGILNACVYNFYSGLNHPNCDKKLDEVSDLVKSNEFSGRVDDMINAVKPKLASDGNMYYVGYAKFWDATDGNCDKVSWHIWSNLFYSEKDYLTQARRQRMNDLVDGVNGVIRAACERAGNQVHFVDYDDDVTKTEGRYCVPGVDENGYHGANRPNLFFYKMLTGADGSPKTDLRRRQETLRDQASNLVNDTSAEQPANATLGAIYGALIEAAISEEMEHGGTTPETFALNPDAVNNDLVAEVKDEVNNSTSGVSASSKAALLPGVKQKSFGNTLRHLIITDAIARVFHPTPPAHAMISMKIKYTMAQVNAARLGVKDFPTWTFGGSNEDFPVVQGNACKGDSSDTWSARDPMFDAVQKFCGNTKNLQGKAGTVASETFNHNSVDYLNISIEYKKDSSVVQHQCVAWLREVTDACDTNSAGNMKHGGQIELNYHTDDMLFQISPLVIRRQFDGGKVDQKDCADAGNLRYLAQSTLANNVKDFCSKVAATKFRNPGDKEEQTYNQDTPEHVTLAVEWPKGAFGFETFEDECNFYMMSLTDGCSPPDEGNPMNWKHGGSMSDNNKVKYSINPQSDRPPAPKNPIANCTTWIPGKGFAPYYASEVTGLGFANSDYGSELLGQWRGCGALTGWKFEYNPTKYYPAEWYAYFQLPRLMAAGCVGRALHSGGGPDMWC